MRVSTMSCCDEILGIVVEWMSKKDLELANLCPKCFNKKDGLKKASNSRKKLALQGDGG